MRIRPSDGPGCRSGSLRDEDGQLRPSRSRDVRDRPSGTSSRRTGQPAPADPARSARSIPWARVSPGTLGCGLSAWSHRGRVVRVQVLVRVVLELEQAALAAEPVRRAVVLVGEQQVVVSTSIPQTGSIAIAMVDSFTDTPGGYVERRHVAVGRRVRRWPASMQRSGGPARGTRAPACRPR